MTDKKQVVPPPPPVNENKTAGKSVSPINPAIPKDTAVKPNPPVSAFVTHFKTNNKPALPVNNPATRDGGKPTAPANQGVTKGGNSGKPTSPSNQSITEGKKK